MKDYRPIIGITMGDPVGIGPEIILTALCEPAIYKVCRPFVIGDAQRLEAAKKYTGSRLNEPLMGHMGSAHGAKAKRLCVSGMVHLWDMNSME